MRDDEKATIGSSKDISKMVTRRASFWDKNAFVPTTKFDEFTQNVALCWKSVLDFKKSRSAPPPTKNVGGSLMPIYRPNFQFRSGDADFSSQNGDVN